MKKWKVKFWPDAQLSHQKKQLKEVVVTVDKVVEIRQHLKVHFPLCEINSVIETV